MNGLGSQLKAAREKMRVTVTEASASTHLKMLVVDAMERDDYPKLIAPTYAKGFYKLYCEYLGLDPEPFIEAYLHFAGVSDDKTELIRDPKKKPGLFSGLQKRMKEMQERKEVQRKAQEIAAAQDKARQLGRTRAETALAEPPPPIFSGAARCLTRSKRRGRAAENLWIFRNAIPHWMCWPSCRWR